MKRLLRRRLPAVLPSGRPSTAPAPPTSRFIVKATLISRAPRPSGLCVRADQKSLFTLSRASCSLLGWSIFFSLSLASALRAAQKRISRKYRKGSAGESLSCVCGGDKAALSLVFAFVFLRPPSICHKSLFLCISRRHHSRLGRQKTLKDDDWL